MKKKAAFIVVLLIAVSAYLSMCACDESPAASEASQTPVLQATETAEATEPEASETPEATQSEADTFVYYSASLDFTVTLPVSWQEDCVIDEEGDYVVFASAANRSIEGEDGATYEAGVLFTVMKAPQEDKQEDGTYPYPDYDLLGTVDGEDIVVLYPTDVQYSEAGAEQYQSMQAVCADVVASITFG